MYILYRAAAAGKGVSSFKLGHDDDKMRRRTTNGRIEGFKSRLWTGAIHFSSTKAEVSQQLHPFRDRNNLFCFIVVYRDVFMWWTWIVALALLCLHWHAYAEIASTQRQEDEDTILVTLLAQRTTDGEIEEIENAVAYKQLLLEKRKGAATTEATEDPDDDIKEDGGNENDKAPIAAPIQDISVLSNERLDTWTLIKRQVASDFAPILGLIPAPIKQQFMAWMQHAKLLSFNIFYGSMKSTLVVASKALSHASTAMSSLVDELERHRSVHPVSSQPKSGKGVLLNRIQKKIKQKRLLSRKKPRSALQDQDKAHKGPVPNGQPNESEEEVIEI